MPISLALRAPMSPWRAYRAAATRSRPEASASACARLQGRARRGVLLGAVVGLDDLHVVVGPQRARRVGDQLQHDVDADGVVGGVDDRDAQRRDVQRGPRVRAEAGRADDQPDALRGRRRRHRLGRAGGREVDPDVRLASRGHRVRDQDAHRLAARDGPRVLADAGVAGPLGRRRQHGARPGGEHRPRQGASHASVGAQDRDANRARHPSAALYSASRPSSSSCARSLARYCSASG